VLCQAANKFMQRARDPDKCVPCLRHQRVAQLGRNTRWPAAWFSAGAVVVCFASGAAVAQTEPVVPSSEDEIACVAFVDAGRENYKRAHEDAHCLKAAQTGSRLAQYSVGMGYGFAGDRVSEEKYYRLAANQKAVAAYLALGHLLAEDRPWEAIYWYQRFIELRPEGYGYAAVLVSKIFQRLGDRSQAAYWLEVCRGSGHEGCR